MTSGTLLVILFMGYGLVKVPKLVWFKKSLGDELNYLYFLVAETEQLKVEQFHKAEELYTVVAAHSDSLRPRGAVQSRQREDRREGVHYPSH